MAQSIIAVDERRTGSIAHNLNVGPRIDCAVLNLFHILRQAEHSVRVPAARVGFGHQHGHMTGIRWSNPHGHQRSRDELHDFRYWNAWLTWRWFGGFAHDQTLCYGVNVSTGLGTLTFS